MLNTWLRRLTRSRRIPVPIYLPARKSRIAAHPMVPLVASPADCPALLVPLATRPDQPAEPAVRPGDPVEPLARLARPAHRGDIGAFSPAQAVVLEWARADTEWACDLPAVRLRLCPQAAWPPQVMDGQAHDGSASLGQDLRTVLAEMARLEDLPATLDNLGVLATRGGGPEPLGQVLVQAAGRTDLLVINAIQAEPRLASHARLAIDATHALVAGTRGLMSYLRLRRATWLVSAAHAFRPHLARRLRRFGIRLLPVRAGFPAGDNSIVLRQLFGRTVPPGQSSDGGGCLALPADVAWRAGLALLRGEPVPFQPITVAGDCLRPAGQRVYLSPVGLTIEGLIECLRQRDLLAREPKVALLGGPMTGTAVVDASRTVVTQSTQAVMLLARKPRLETTGCVRCGWCVYGCPAGLDPIAILNALEAGRPRRVRRLAVQRCLRCGVCSAVCPSHLPLAQAVRAGQVQMADTDPG